MFLMIPLFFAAGYLFEYLAALISIMLHELGHIAAAACFGSAIKSVRLLPAGLTVLIDEKFHSRRNTIIICSAGPVVNIFIALLSCTAVKLFPEQQDFLYFLSLSNIYLAVLNLLPAIPLDGGRILQEILSDRIGMLSAGRYLRRIAFVLSFVFLALGVVQMINSRVNFTFFTVGIYLILLLIKGRMEAALMNIRQMVYRHSRLVKKGVYPARDLVAIKTTLLCDILKEMDHDRFHFVYVLDDKLKTIKVFNENEIMEGMLKLGSNISLEQLVNSTVYNNEADMIF